MTATEPVEDLEPFAVFGLYRHRQDPMIIMARDKAHASAQFHAAVPGLEGTVFHNKALSELMVLDASEG